MTQLTMLQRDIYNAVEDAVNYLDAGLTERCPTSAEISEVQMHLRKKYEPTLAFSVANVLTLCCQSRPVECAVDYPQSRIFTVVYIGTCLRMKCAPPLEGIPPFFNIGTALCIL